MTPDKAQGDDAFWSAYVKGVRKLGSETEEPALPRKKEPETIVLPPPAPSKDAKKPTPPVYGDALPEAWRARLKEEGDFALLEPAPPQPPKTQEAAFAASVPSDSPSASWRREPLDLRIERNLSLGDVMIEARLDLHGKTEAQAHESLIAFVEKQRRLGRRLILIVTGRGREGESVLRTNLPRWCDVPPLAEALQAVRVAAPHHGGEGAYYLLLRKKNG